MRIAFGIVSSKEPVAVLTQLTAALGTRHPIFIHHDHRKSQTISIAQPNVHVLDNPEDTGWGTWGFVRGILRTIEAAAKHGEFDYYQLLSATCLPIKSIECFEKSVALRSCDVNMALVNLDTDQDAMMSHGFRVLARKETIRSRLLSYARKWYFSARYTRRERAGLGMIKIDQNGVLGMPLKARLALGITQHMRASSGSIHPFNASLSPYVGSTWFGANRVGCEFLLARSPDDVLEDFFQDASLCDESYFHTLFGNSSLRIGPSHHFISEFHEHHPRTLEIRDYGAVVASPKFFARKFSVQPQDALRHSILRRLAPTGTIA
jgi:hypothetical protein